MERERGSPFLFYFGCAPASTYVVRENERVHATPSSRCKGMDQPLYLREAESRFPTEDFILLLMSGGLVITPHEISVLAMCAHLMVSNPHPGLTARVINKRLCRLQLFLHQEFTISNLQRLFCSRKRSYCIQLCKNAECAVTSNRAMRVIKTIVENVNGNLTGCKRESNGNGPSVHRKFF